MIMEMRGGPGRQAARLLLVEDEPVILELLCDVLNDAGFDVVQATTGTGAVRAVHQHHPDLITLDVSLPGMDGFAVIRQLRESGLRIPVIFVSARDSEEDRERASSLGAADYISKPFGLEELVRRVRAVLGRAETSARDEIID